jgi:hypothetical protein
VFAVALSWIARSARKPDGFVRHFSRGAFMRDLNESLAEKSANTSPDISRPHATR